MKKYIVTTTINPPTEATILYSQKPGWTLLVVGDKKTPHDLYQDLNCIYLTPQLQEDKYPELSQIIGWNSIQRRNIGLLDAYLRGADIIATVDDDNIPYDKWGQNLLINQEIEIDCWSHPSGVFDPLSVTNHPSVWHRGYPIELVPTRNQVTYLGKQIRKVLVQADLWDGDPDIDAMARLSQKPMVKFSIDQPYGSTDISPFNSQNTFLAREVIPFYSVFPHVGRMDDIWGSYVLQHKYPRCVVYNQASVYQRRNPQDLITNLEKEIIGYRYTNNIATDPTAFERYAPPRTIEYWDIYRKSFTT